MRPARHFVAELHRDVRQQRKVDKARLVILLLLVPILILLLFVQLQPPALVLVVVGNDLQQAGRAARDIAGPRDVRWGLAERKEGVGTRVCVRRVVAVWVVIVVGRCVSVRIAESTSAGSGIGVRIRIRIRIRIVTIARGVVSVRLVSAIRRGVVSVRLVSAI